MPDSRLLSEKVTTFPRPLLLLGLALLLAPGCGPSTDRLPFSGKVTLDGAPLDRGSIRFSGVQEGKKLSAGARIRDGVFSVPTENGLPPGSYSVQITSPTNEMILYRTGPNDPGVRVAKDRIPKSYNVESDVTKEISASGDNEFNFDIVSEL